MFAAVSAAFMSGHGWACSSLYSSSFSGLTLMTIPIRWTFIDASPLRNLYVPKSRRACAVLANAGSRLGEEPNVAGREFERDVLSHFRQSGPAFGDDRLAGRKLGVKISG